MEIEYEPFLNKLRNGRIKIWPNEQTNLQVNILDIDLYGKLMKISNDYNVILATLARLWSILGKSRKSTERVRSIFGGNLPVN